jgi:hypothetical protein
MKKSHSTRAIAPAITAIDALKKSMRLVVWSAAAPFLVMALPGHAADPFPSKPIQLIIPFAPGDTDNMIRPFADRMGEFWGNPLCCPSDRVRVAPLALAPWPAANQMG